MNITQEQVTAIQDQVQRYGISLSRSEIEEAAANFDLDAAKEDAGKRVTIQRWDMASPVNGASAEEIFAARQDIPEDGAVYLLSVDGTVRYFQPHSPDTEGLEPIGEDEWESVAEAHRGQVVEQLANDRFQKVIQDLIKSKG